MIERVRHAIEKYRMLASGERVLIGLSGGADSVCLALVLKNLGYDLGVAHVNHSLRGAESDADEAFSRHFGEELGLPVFLKRIALRPEGNLEAQGREARKEFFADVACEHGFTKIALAHTKNDRVETFFMHLLRGSGSEGLVSMAPVSGSVIRPLIGATRKEVEAFLREHNQIWCTDSTNFDLSLARNRLRQVVIPLLAEDFNLNLIETLSRTVEILESEDAWMRAETDRWLRENGTREEDGFVIRVGPLEGKPMGWIRRILRESLRREGSDLRDVSFDHVEAARRLLEPGKSGKFVEFPGGLQAAREFDRLVFRAAPAILGEYEYELRIPGHVHIPELGKVFRAEIVEAESDQTAAQRVFVDGDSIGPYVRIRNWKPGDYYRPAGWPAGKLKKLFQRARIPRSHRRGWPVVVADSAIVWVASFPVSREFAPRGRSQKIVALEALRA